MGLLTDTDLQNIIVDNRDTDRTDDKLLISPYSPESMTPVGYDLRIGNGYSSRKSGKYFGLKENQELIIKSGDTILVRTLERIEMPRNRAIS